MSLLTTVFIGLLGQVMPPVLPNEPAPGMAPQEPPKLMVHMVALSAWEEGLDEVVIDEKLSLDEALLEKLPFDNFVWVNEAEEELEMGAEPKPLLFPIDSNYRMLVALAGQPGQDGSIPLHAKVLMRANGQTEQQALYGNAMVSPNKWLIFRGLPLAGKELVILLELKQGGGEGEGSGQSEQQQEQEEGEEKEDEQEPQPGEDQQEQQPSEQKESQDKPKDLQNIEALLENLEEQDKREQAEARFNRENIRINKDWW